MFPEAKPKGTLNWGRRETKLAVMSPARAVIKCFVIPSNSKIEKNAEKSFSWRRLTYKFLQRFQWARPDYVRVKRFPRELVSFVCFVLTLWDWQFIDNVGTYASQQTSWDFIVLFQTFDWLNLKIGHLIDWIWKCGNLLFQFCHLIGFHCLSGPGFSKLTVKCGSDGIKNTGVRKSWPGSGVSHLKCIIGKTFL